MVVKDPNPRRQPLMQQQLLLEGTQRRWLPNPSLLSQSLHPALHLNRSVLLHSSNRVKNTIASFRYANVVSFLKFIVQGCFKFAERRQKCIPVV